ncbi:hypothetical protein Fot_53071 [Forsythia ovata]|uniref:Myb-like domain-containing protein n=1 Tax=Forsythia ovata TaxID=205694 RepID=A0ABD1PHM5_9LAMI
MATSSETRKKGSIQGNGSISRNGNSVHGLNNGAVPTLQYQQNISTNWTSEEQAMLEEGLAKYASESNIVCYAKIAVQLEKKTVRDVALRCRWMTVKEARKRGKEDLNVTRKSKGKREKIVDPSGKPSRLAIQQDLPPAPGTVTNYNKDSISYNDGGAATRQLLQQNAWTFEQISSNLATHQIQENIFLLCQARDNICNILNNLNDKGPTIKKMPPLPNVNEELANSILGLFTIEMQ